jgi:hypothetical protein
MSNQFIPFYTSQHQSNLMPKERQLAIHHNMTLNIRSEITRTNLRWNNLHKLLIDCNKFTLRNFFPKFFNSFLITKNRNFFQHAKTKVKIFFRKIWHKIFNPKKINIINFQKTHWDISLFGLSLNTWLSNFCSTYWAYDKKLPSIRSLLIYVS